MATINQLPSGAFRARVRRQGAPTLSRSFTSREDAEQWASATERAIATGTLAEHRHRDTTLRQLLTLYKVRITRRKKGARQEQRRIDALARDRLAAFSLSNLYRAALREFRDRRAKEVSGSTVNRDLALLSVVLKWARAELDAPVDPTMLAGLKLPENAARERRLLPGEFERLLVASPGWLRAWVTLAVESGMRRGEIAGLTWEQIDLLRRVCNLATSKNGSGRRVPLSSRAVAVLEQLRKPEGRVFNVRPDSVTQEFRRACTRAGIEGLRLHDLRAEAVSRLFERGLDMNSVKSISGHKSMIIMRYMRSGDAEQLAQRLG